MTKEEILKAAEYCLEHGDSCQGCPLIERGGSCTEMFADYILKEKEPVPQSSDTSSKVSEDTANLHFNNNAKTKKSQALKDVEIALELVDNTISETEKIYFDLGKAFNYIRNVQHELRNIKEG
nr:MAG: hypothetical protein [Bacteriophage sp.]